MVYISNGEFAGRGSGAAAGLGGRISGFFRLRPPGLASVAAFLDLALRSQADPQTKWPGPVARHRSYGSRRARAEVPVVTTVPGAQRPGSRRASDVGLAKVVFPLGRLCL